MKCELCGYEKDSNDCHASHGQSQPSAKTPKEIFAFLYTGSNHEGKFSTAGNDIYTTSYTRTDIAQQYKKMQDTGDKLESQLDSKDQEIIDLKLSLQVHEDRFNQLKTAGEELAEQVKDSLNGNNWWGKRKEALTNWQEITKGM